mmetsp:Transcript_12097/g.39812  ORF Transcript_12097/g.39812 Transcript_12097/m.39812 type:complete len:228 (+) Transcript_12097:212-895(+)
MAASSDAAVHSDSGSAAPSRSAATLAAFCGWSQATCSATTGTPLPQASEMELAPPWHTRRRQQRCASSARCGSHGAVRTFGAPEEEEKVVFQIAGSPSEASASRTAPSLPSAVHAPSAHEPSETTTKPPLPAASAHSARGGGSGSAGCDASTEPQQLSAPSGRLARASGGTKAALWPTTVRTWHLLHSCFGGAPTDARSACRRGPARRAAAAAARIVRPWPCPAAGG